MNDFLLPGLVANAATLGVYWIYDADYLKALAEEQSLLFMSQSKEHYDQAKPSFFVYPNNEIGDVSLQGEILKWLFNALKDDHDLSQAEFRRLVVEQLKPGGDYTGYVESYGKQLVYNHLMKDLKEEANPIEVNDKQLVGFIPYLVCKALELGNDKAWTLAQVFTNDKTIHDFYTFFDHLIAEAPIKGMQKAIKAAIEYAPKDYQEKLEKAVDMEDTDKFIENYAGRACPYKHAIPVITHILYHARTFEEAIEMNAVIGGASSDRGILLGVLANINCPIPQAWIDKTKDHIE